MNKKLLCLTNRIALRIDPAPDAVQTTADLVVMLLTTRCPASLSVRANPETQQSGFLHSLQLWHYPVLSYPAADAVARSPRVAVVVLDVIHPACSTATDPLQHHSCNAIFPASPD